MSINTVIVEDEEKSLYVLKEFLGQLAPDIRVCGSAGHIEEGVRLISDIAPQLVFLDVRIADGLGFEVLNRVAHRHFELICITAYDNYACDAFRYAAVDYLLKPIDMQELAEAIERVRNRMREKIQLGTVETLLRSLPQQYSQEKKIGIPTANGYDLVSVQDILWCRSEGAYTVFYLSNTSKITSSRNLGAFEEALSRYDFFRIHHNTIVNMRRISRYVKGRGGSIVLSDGTELEVSQRRKNEFMERFLA
jgi:two-component system LytT family response regulator